MSQFNYRNNHQRKNQFNNNKPHYQKKYNNDNNSDNSDDESYTYNKKDNSRIKNNNNNYNNNNFRNNNHPSHQNYMKNNINKSNNDENYFNNSTKQLLLEYVYNKIKLSNYKYTLIEYEYDLTLLKEKPYYVSANYTGIHSLLIFVKIKNKFLSVIIDRKTLTYNLNQIDYNRVKIIPVHHRLDESIYDGTIIDGVLLYNTFNGVKTFVINDLYYFRGINLFDDKISNKMLNINIFFEKNKDDNNVNNTIFVVNKLYPLTEIQQLINLYIPKSKYNKCIKGIAFYPEYSSSKLIYLFNNCSHDENNLEEKNDSDDKIKNNEKDDVKIENMSNIQFKGDINSLITFRIKKTDTVDVYNLYIGDKTIGDNGKKIIKYKKMGIAFLPTSENSHFCRNIFSQTNETNLLVDCKYDSEKNRWIPVKLTTNKKIPDLIDKIK